MTSLLKTRLRQPYSLVLYRLLTQRYQVQDSEHFCKCQILHCETKKGRGHTAEAEEKSKSSSKSGKLVEKDASMHGVNGEKQAKFKPFNVKKKLMSPMDRLNAVLPEEYKTRLNNENLMDKPEDKTPEDAENVSAFKNLNIDNQDNSVGTKSPYSKTSTYRTGRAYKSSTFRARSLQPSKTLANLLQSDYWDKISDAETKEVVDDLAESSPSKSDNADHKIK